MKIGKYDITLANIKAYIQGNIRKIIDNYGMDFTKLDDHVKEQIIWRNKVANPYCLSAKECIACGCPTPDVFYANKACNQNCYPEMMNKEEWEKYKLEKSITLDNNTENKTIEQNEQSDTNK